MSLHERQNRFDMMDTSRQEFPSEFDKLGNYKPLEQEVVEPRTRNEKKATQTRTAVSPPDARRGRDRGAEMNDNASGNGSSAIDVKENLSAQQVRGRTHDHHSNIGYGVTEKKIKQGWGDLVGSEMDVMTEVPDPRDPGSGKGRHLSETSLDENVKTETLDEYLANQPVLAAKYRRPDPRPPMVDSLDTPSRKAVPLERH
ncbi:hypothetical protein BDF14DRAFT_1813064 [Spinellus fusiger]|nr:hypothetical protein BDF14DRAFT_1813064 [Spinellus fusiger]